MTNRRQGSDAKGKQSKAATPFTQVKQLYVGLQDWTIRVRVMFINPCRTFINKKGMESTMLTLEVGDKTGNIDCTVCGDMAQRLDGTMKEDQIYEITEFTGALTNLLFGIINCTYSD